MTSIDNVMKSKLNTYNLAKGSLVQMQRKRTWGHHYTLRIDVGTYSLRRGNLSVRSLADIVTSEHIIEDSEYLDSIILAVPKSGFLWSLFVSPTKYCASGTLWRNLRPNTSDLRQWLYQDRQCKHDITLPERLRPSPRYPKKYSFGRGVHPV